MVTERGDTECLLLQGRMTPSVYCYKGGYHVVTERGDTECLLLQGRIPCGN